MITSVENAPTNQTYLETRSESPTFGRIQRHPKRSQDLIVWGRHGSQLRLAARCAHCDGNGDFLTEGTQRIPCDSCDGFGWFGIDPRMPSATLPGTTERIAVLAVRYASGIPLWHYGDQAER